VGILGLNHDHVWGNLAALNDNELGQVVAAADPDPRLRDGWRASMAAWRRSPATTRSWSGRISTRSCSSRQPRLRGSRRPVLVRGQSPMMQKRLAAAPPAPMPPAAARHAAL